LPATNNGERDRPDGILDVGAHRCINAAANLKQGVSIRLMSAAVIYGASIRENLVPQIMHIMRSISISTSFPSLTRDLTRTGT